MTVTDTLATQKRNWVATEDISPVVSGLLKQGYLTGDVLDEDGENRAFVFDLDAVRNGFENLISAFPAHFKHCLAIKSNSSAFFVKLAVQAGLGVEAASLAELHNGLVAGAKPEDIVFDCPAKTAEDVKIALLAGVHLNANCNVELERITKVRERLGEQNVKGTVGLRINFLVGAGSIAELSVANKTSKFGVVCTEETKEEVLQTFKDLPWLAGLHVHIGSQGMALDTMVTGVKKMVELADWIDEKLGTKRIKFLDIGGGLAGNYETDAFSPSFMDYATLLRKEVPSLLTNTSRCVMTEFGRSLTLKTAFAISRIEYLIDNDEFGTAIIQFGADCFPREAYAPAVYSHRVMALSKEGQALEGEGRRYNVAGPLCFAGDVIKKNAEFPELNDGDFIIIRDVGANTLSLFSRHCSRKRPAIYGYSRNAEGALVCSLLQARERLGDLLNSLGYEVARDFGGAIEVGAA